MYVRNSGAAYAVTGPEYCDGSFRPRKYLPQKNFVSGPRTCLAPSFHHRMRNKQIRFLQDRGGFQANNEYIQLEGLRGHLP